MSPRLLHILFLGLGGRGRFMPWESCGDGNGEVLQVSCRALVKVKEKGTTVVDKGASRSKIIALATL